MPVLSDTQGDGSKVEPSGCQSRRDDLSIGRRSAMGSP